jgi:hypothetical protein
MNKGDGTRGRRRLLLATGAALALIAGGAGVAVATGGGDDDEDDRPISGQALERASAAALDHTGGGTVTATETGDEESSYEVEVTREDGSQVDVQLDRDFSVVGDETDDDASGDESETSALPQGPEHVELDPGSFTTEIDNPYWPMAVGSRWVYRETEPGGAEQRVVVTVTPRTKRIANGIDARVVHDVVSEGGRPVEVTDDWYAQDADGNVWYLGEATTEYENGRPVSHAGSFEAGVDGAEPGIAVPADPQPGLRYRQEYYAGDAEDQGTVVALGEQAQVPAGHYGDVMMTRDTNPLEPRVLEFKFYAPGVGPVLAVNVSGGGGREDLVAYRPGR